MYGFGFAHTLSLALSLATAPPVVFMVRGPPTCAARVGGRTVYFFCQVQPLTQLHGPIVQAAQHVVHEQRDAAVERARLDSPAP